MTNRFYLTTAIDYPNGVPHQGHAYERVIADAVARFQRLQGREVFFLTGTDENTQNVVEKAKQAGVPTTTFVDEKVRVFQELLTTYHITNSDFIRTTQPHHVALSQQLFQAAFDRGDIYLTDYEGLYCTGCEAFYTEKDLIDGKLCPDHQRPVETRKEKAYFFKLSRYHQKILALLKTDFIQPRVRANELIARLENEPLRDLCVSRQVEGWGIRVPFDASHAIYVWFDALINYLSGIHYDFSKKENPYWPADVHVIGKGIGWFHAVIWPAMLLSLEIPLPRHLLIHGYINDDKGQKMSKTIGNVIDPFAVIKEVPVDSVRYYLLREVSLESDMNFSIAEIKNRHNNELANELGNLLNRTLSLIEKNYDGKIPEGKNTLADQLPTTRVKEAYENFNSFIALDETFTFIRSVNRYLSEKEPWKMKPGADLSNVLYTAADSLSAIAILLTPVIPDAAQKIHASLGGASNPSWNEAVPNQLPAGTTIKKSGILFPKL